MYHAMMRRIARKNFERINERDYNALLKDCVPNVHHRFGGRHALSGERHDRHTLKLWFERLSRLAPNLRLAVQDVWVKGLPHKTTLIIRWTGEQTAQGSTVFANRGVHIVEMRWGKIVSIDANEDSQAVNDWLKRQVSQGIVEAAAEPIVS